MAILAQHWLVITAIFIMGGGLGAFLTHRIQRTHNRNGLVRWERRLRETQHEHEKELTRFSQTLSAAEKKELNLRNALRESEETVRLLSEENVPAYENEIRQRNERLAELQRKLSHQRAELADAKDQEATDRREVDRLRAELAAKDTRIDELLMRNAEFSGLKELNAEQERRYAGLSGQLETERQQRQAMETAFRERLEQETLALREAQKELERLHTRERAAEQNAPDYRAELAARDARIATISLEFDEMRRRLPALNDALREREASIEDLIAELSRERKKNRQLQQERTQNDAAPEISPPVRHAKVINLRPHLRTDAVARHLGRHDSAAQRISAVENEPDDWKQRATTRAQPDNNPASRPAATSQQHSSGATAPARQDDLKQVRGIGPVLESTLNELGIVCFDQLATLSEDEVAALGRYDKSLPQRLKRDRWIEQARSFIAPDA
ncbi:MAG: hypothetical protein KJO54_08720 [Gammaproteobacteria bacterium]|nr:hypothetical protein [Gammaproteobacteria bacterium]NNF60323.1 hypothetical protein [Gammaproteobacteria bacterium]NNM20633.1 hypothetical protein [Gammaproteobacteria bacterium]